MADPSGLIDQSRPSKAQIRPVAGSDDKSVKESGILVSPVVEGLTARFKVLLLFCGEASLLALTSTRLVNTPAALGRTVNEKRLASPAGTAPKLRSNSGILARSFPTAPPSTS